MRSWEVQMLLVKARYPDMFKNILDDPPIPLLGIELKELKAKS